MDVPDRAEQEPEPISIARCRELLGDEADTLSDEEVLDRRASRGIDGARRDRSCLAGRSHPLTAMATTTHLAGVR